MQDEPVAEGAPEGETEAPLHCDFCGKEASHVRRVALDGQYDRLQQPHHARYACDPCSEAKERERLAAS
jgi:hypothetical protein